MGRLRDQGPKPFDGPPWHRGPRTDADPALRTLSPGDVGHHVRLAVRTPGQRIGGVRELPDEAAPLLVEGHPGPERGRGGVEVDAVLAEILAAALERVGHLGVARG